ncbi:hypothetical protein P7C73_g336, partial [Tremellales sp. Uapishka_1]
MDENAEWQSSPMYLALSSRLAATETTLASLSSQVAALSAQVKAALPSPSPFAPFDSPTPPSSDASVAALTQQISALSTSVAQLQRLQSTSQLTRQPSAQGGVIPRHLADPPLVSNNGRPNMARAFSSSVLGDGDKWAPKVSTPRVSDWPSPGPGGLMTPTTSLNGGTTPGAGIVVTKWEHLNLKMDLLRSILKYGIGPPNKIQARVLPFMLKGSDIIAQAPPTQERIISYVVPALQLCLTLPPQQQYRGPNVIIITTTVDQATQCQKPAGASGSSGIPSEIAAIQRDAVHVLIGTPAKMQEVMTLRGGLSGSEVRLLILDEVDQLINRSGLMTPSIPYSPNTASVTSPYDVGRDSPFNPASSTPFPQPARFGTPANGGNVNGIVSTIERQTCLFSNTIPTDVINFSQSLQVRDPVRVLVRREGGINSQESVSSITPGIHLKHTYVYLTITGSARSDAATPQAELGPGTIGSGRTATGLNEEATKAKEFKLDTLVKMLEDYPLWQAIIHVGTFSMLEAVVYKLTARQWETLYLAPDMPPAQKKAVLQQWRSSQPGNGPRFLVIFDVNVKPPDVPWSPLVVNFDLPRSVEGYAARAVAAMPPSSRGGPPHINGVIVSFVQAAGGDVEMLRSTECAYRFKSAEIPTVFHDLFQQH